jgi:hypothetical protein
LEDVSESERLCHSAVFIRKGVLGSSSFTSAEGEPSMLAIWLRGPSFRLWETV